MTASHYPAVFELTRQRDNSVGHGSAVLLDGGRYLLTAAHLVAGASTGSVRLRSNDLAVLPDIAAIHVHPEWDDSTYNNDIALIELSSPVTTIDGLQTYQGAVPVGAEFIRVGYGYGFEQGQHIGANTWDSTGEILNSAYGRSVPDGSQLLADYDNGTQAQNSLNTFSGVDSSPVPVAGETISLAGDSGGPALVDGKVAGIASYIIADPDLDSDPDTASSPGEMSADSNVLAYQSWLDFVMYGNPVYTAPQQQDEVQTTVTEPDYGSVINYFLLSSNQTFDTPVQLWYETVDGSAVAGEDYEASQGWVTLQPGQRQVSIPISILGDRDVEGVESFSLKISDPSGEWLENGVTLLATHIIHDNDFFSL